MNKKEFVEKFAEKAGITKKEADAYTAAFLGVLTDAYVAGDDVNFVGFGKFTVKKRAEKKGRNPKTSEEIMIPATSIPSFVAGKILKDKVNG